MQNRARGGNKVRGIGDADGVVRGSVVWEVSVTLGGDGGLFDKVWTGRLVVDAWKD